MMKRYIGIFLIPHELLHVLGYKLIGKPYAYEWGNHQVISLSQRTRQERLLIALLPFCVFFGLGLFFHSLWIGATLWAVIQWHLNPLQFLWAATWPLVCMGLGTLLVLYSGTAHADLSNIYYLLFRYDDTEYQRQ